MAGSQQFNARFRTLTTWYESGLGAVLRRTGRMLLLYVALCAALCLGLSSLPSSFLPDEDQGYFMSSIQLPSDATMQRTLRVVKNLKRKLRPGRILKATL